MLVSVVALIAFVVLLLLLTRPNPAPAPADPEPGSSAPAEPTPTDPVPTPNEPDPTPTEPEPEPTPSQPDEPEDPTDPAAAILTDSPIYPHPIPSNTCTEIGAAPTDTAGLESYGQLWVECLSESWAPLITEQTGTFAPPGFVVFTSEQVQTQCGTAGGAFYCSADHTIYIGSDYIAAMNTTMAQLPLGVSYYYVMVHEYHHHVQNSVGMLDAYLAVYSGDYLEGSRRLELQDQCWVSMVLRTTPGYDFTPERQESWLYLLSHSTSPQHGDSTSTVHWGTVGLTAETLGDCNTWIAPSEQVT